MNTHTHIVGVVEKLGPMLMDKRVCNVLSTAGKKKFIKQTISSK